MRCRPECHSCLGNLASRCASLATADPQICGQVLERALLYLDQNFSLDCISTVLAAELQRIIRRETGNSDPFAAAKMEEIALARRCTERFALPEGAALPELIRFAARGNGFDFFQDLRSLEKQFREPVVLARDHIGELQGWLEEPPPGKRRSIVYLADNAGECLFDLPLLRFLGETASVSYAVKGSPVQNDLSLADLDRSGLRGSFPAVATTGTDSPGLDLAASSPAFKELLRRSDLILAKGMGHYETLPELSLPQPVFLIFQVKCDPIAQDSGLPRHSYAAYFLDR